VKQVSKSVTSNQDTLKNARRRRIGGGILIILLTVLAYLPALSGKFIWDDDSWTTGIVGLLKDSHGLYSIWCQPTALQQYYPLSGTTFWLDYHLWGFHPLPYHVENLLLHIVSALLFWALLRRLQIPGAWLGGALFALHPVMVESVAWITERKNVLSLALYLGALLAYLRFAQGAASGQCPVTRTDSIRPRVTCHGSLFYFLAFVLFAGALLAKATAFSLPAVILVIGWWQRGRLQWRRDILPTLPFFVTSIGFCLGTAWLEKNHVGAKGAEWMLTFPERCLIAGRAFWFYLGKLVWPGQLCFVYPRWQVNTGIWWQWLYPLTAVVTLVALWWGRGRIGRGPLAGVLIYVGTLFPVLGFMNAYFMKYSFVCDHWVYLSSLGLIALIAALVTRAVERLHSKAMLYGFCAVILPVLGWLTWRQCGIYADIETLWRDTLVKNPGAWLAHNNLGVALWDRGKASEAIAHYQQALQFDPTYVQAYNNLGVAYKEEGKIDEAIKQYEQALRFNPDFPEAQFNLGVALEAADRENEAIDHYKEALRLKSDFFEARCALGGILIRQGRIQEAVEHYNEALKLQPDSAETHFQLGLALVQQGKREEAIGQWQQALILKPDYPEAEYNWGLALEQMDKSNDAIGHYEQALRLKSGFFEAHCNLGGILLRQGKIQEAIEQYSDAAKVQPGSVETQNSLALALWQAGQAKEAIAHWDEAIRIQPDYPVAQNSLAWVLATLGPDKGGDPARAVALAEQACKLTEHRIPGNVDTLATAYAAAGRFNDAVAEEQKALELARAAGQSQLAGEIEARLQLYRDGHTYNQAPPVAGPHNP
jgi:tetratricopeptide (TPR) repeat protein